MKFIFLLFTQVLLFQSVFSQNYILEYYPNINKAESYLVDGKYTEALLHFEKAFVLKGLGNDYYNAAICCVLIGQYEQAAKYLLNLADKGLTVNYFKKNRIFEKIPTNIYSDFLIEYHKRYKSFNIRKNLNLISKLDSLVFEDQKLEDMKIHIPMKET